MIQKRFYKRLSEFLAENIKSISMEPEEFARRVHCVNPEIVIKAKEKGHLPLVCACHQFNWEWALIGGTIHMKTLMDPIYMRLTHKGFDNMIKKIRSKAGGEPIEMKESGIRYARSIKKGHGIANVADQIPPRTGTEKVWIDFLNRETAFFTGLDQLTNMFKLYPLFLKIHSPKRGYYTIEFIPLAEPGKHNEDFTVTKAYAYQLEKMIVEHPSEWLWSHKRWKYNRNDPDVD